MMLLSTSLHIATLAITRKQRIMHFYFFLSEQSVLSIAIQSNSNVVISWNILRACAELGITRVAQASSVNVVTLLFSQHHHFKYFPIDEQHPCESDEPYGHRSTIHFHESRLHWSIPCRAVASVTDLKSSGDISSKTLVQKLSF
jgi:UDP-glucose 4-epimerase